MALNFHVTIEDGKIKFKDKLNEYFAKYIPSLKNGIYTLKFERYFPNRTSSQNKALFGLWLPFLAKYHEVSTKEIHLHIKEEYLTQERLSPITNKMVYSTRWTSDLTTKEFSDLIEVIRQDYLEQYKLKLPDAIPQY